MDRVRLFRLLKNRESVDKVLFALVSLVNLDLALMEFTCRSITDGFGVGKTIL